MIRWALRKAIGKFEHDWNYDAAYMRDLIEVSPRAAWLFSRVTALGQFRRDVPIDAWCAAGITAVRHEDCGPCTQLGVTMAERAGVSPAVLRAVLADDGDAMPPGMQRVGRNEGLAVELYFAFVRPDVAAEHFHDRALTRAVFADQRVNLTGLDLKLYTAQSLRRAKALLDAKHSEARNSGAHAGTAAYLRYFAKGG